MTMFPWRGTTTHWADLPTTELESGNASQKPKCLMISVPARCCSFGAQFDSESGTRRANVILLWWPLLSIFVFPLLRATVLPLMPLLLQDEVSSLDAGLCGFLTGWLTGSGS